MKNQMEKYAMQESQNTQERDLVSLQAVKTREGCTVSVAT